MESSTTNGPQYPANEGAKITGDPANQVETGLTSGNATESQTPEVGANDGNKAGCVQLVEVSEAELQTTTVESAESESRSVAKRERQKRKRANRRKRREESRMMECEVNNLSERLQHISTMESTPEEGQGAKKFKGETLETSETPRSQKGQSSVDTAEDAESNLHSKQKGQKLAVSSAESRKRGNAPDEPVEGPGCSKQANLSAESRKRGNAQMKPVEKGAGKPMGVEKRMRKRSQPHATETATKQSKGNDGQSQRETFAQVAYQDLKMGVIDRSRERMEGPHLGIFQDALLRGLDSLPVTVGDIGFLGSATLEAGLIAVKCRNQATKAWLIDWVGKNANLWEGANLHIDTIKKVREETRMIILVPVKDLSKEVILGRLLRQNACVSDISKWRVTRVDVYGEAPKQGTMLTVWCPKEQAEAVRSAGSILNCGMNTAKVIL